MQNIVRIIIFVQSSCPVALIQMCFQPYLALTQNHFTQGPQDPNSVIQLTITSVRVVLVQNPMVCAGKFKYCSSCQWPSAKIGTNLLYNPSAS